MARRFGPGLDGLGIDSCLRPDDPFGIASLVFMVLEGRRWASRSLRGAGSGCLARRLLSSRCRPHDESESAGLPRGCRDHARGIGIGLAGGPIPVQFGRWGHGCRGVNLVLVGFAFSMRSQDSSRWRQVSRIGDPPADATGSAAERAARRVRRGRLRRLEVSKGLPLEGSGGRVRPQWPLSS